MSPAPKAMPIYPGLIGKVAVVTGASSGIGAETARYLAANMVTVVVNSRNRDKLNKVAVRMFGKGRHQRAGADDATV